MIPPAPPPPVHSWRARYRRSTAALLVAAASAAAVLLAAVLLRVGLQRRGRDPAPDATAAALVAAPAASTPASTPTPLPTPSADWPLARCYHAPADLGVGFVIQLAGPRSIFQGCQIIAYYGYPGVPSMGVLGSAGPEQVVARLERQAAAYDAVNGARGVAPALELVAAVAQGSPGPDGSYVYRMPRDLLEQYLRVAREHDLLVILDLQVGRSSVQAEVEHLLPYLRDPRVNLALDPEFAMPPGKVPGVSIGTLDAATINATQDELARLVREAGLPDKVLVVHQFLGRMISDKPALERVPGVNLVIDMDGFGGQAAKLSKYTRFVEDEHAPHGGIKLFYQHDAGLLTPDQVAHLRPQPDLVIYQ